ncbi:hypothetical protein [Aequorivita nionensis]|uniref:hypothetical protein n=1 Tax=Aequorivita nionensis TaxID=1287690 RepID=UPI00396594E0
MKPLQTFFIFSFLLMGTKTFSANEPLALDKNKIIQLSMDYISILQKTINQKLDSYYGEMHLCFNDPIKNDHAYDLSNKDTYEFVFAYLSDAKKAYNIESIDIDPEEIELLDCTYFDPITSQTYTYVKVPKTINWSSKKTSSYDNYLSINVTNSSYSIEKVFDDSAETHMKYLAPCLKKSLDTQKQQELAKQIDSLYKKVSFLYSEKKYLEALQIVESILQLNPHFQSAIDAKSAIIDLVDTEAMDNTIQQVLSEGKISIARENLEIAKKYIIGGNAKYKDWELKIQQVEKERKQELDFQTAGHFYKNEMYAKALEIYLELKKEGFKNPNLDNLITASKEFDPQLIQKRIKAAFNSAVSSKKNYEQTFKTYFKYENSGFLQGTNFHFMCLMMLDNGNKRLLREMGMTPNQSQNLAIKYFYKAREMGVDNKNVEFQVFTSNFNKKWKN